MLILLRHGRTPVNAEKLVQGTSDLPLDELGEAQARRAGEYIGSRWDIDAVVTTSLRRTRQTAELAGFDPATHEVDDRWREVSFGAYEQRSVADVVVELGSKWQADITYTPEGGESLASLHERVVAACEELIERSADENILVVSHATPIKSAVIWATGGSPAMINNLWLHTGTLSVLKRAHGNVMLMEFNRQLHDPA